MADAPAQSHSPWLTPEEAADYLRYPTVKALYQAVRRGDIPVHRRGSGGRAMLFHREELDRALLGR